MGKAILAMIVTVIVGYISGAIFANWVNAPALQIGSMHQSGALFLLLL